MWLLITLSHSKRINKKMLQLKPFPLPPHVAPNTLILTHTKTLILQRKGHLYPCSEGDSPHPTLFQIGKYPELIMVCIDILTFFSCICSSNVQ